MLWLLLIIPFLILIILSCLPITIKLTLHIDGDVTLQVRLRWLAWSLRQWQYHLPSAPKSTPKASKRRLSPWAGLAADWELLRRYSLRAWQALHLRLTEATWQLQMSDPAAMGWLFATTAAINWPQPPVLLTIDYGEANRLSGDVNLVARLFPAEWIWVLVNFVWERPIRSLILARLRKKGGK